MSKVPQEIIERLELEEDELEIVKYISPAEDWKKQGRQLMLRPPFEKSHVIVELITLEWRRQRLRELTDEPNDVTVNDMILKAEELEEERKLKKPLTNIKK